MSTPELANPESASDAVGPQIAIRYCRQCNWLLRSAWYAQELLTTFATDLGGVALVPSTGGEFTIWLDDKLLWDRATHQGFPEIKRLKQIVRDQIAPERDLGHVDRTNSSDS